MRSLMLSLPITSLLQSSNAFMLDPYRSRYHGIHHSRMMATSTKKQIATSPFTTKLRNKNFYEILGSSQDDSTEVLKANYHALARKTHPDAMIATEDDDEDDESNDEKLPDFFEISTAWKTLSNFKLRRRYDRSLMSEVFGDKVAEVADGFGKLTTPWFMKLIDAICVPVDHPYVSEDDETDKDVMESASSEDVIETEDNSVDIELGVAIVVPSVQIVAPEMEDVIGGGSGDETDKKVLENAPSDDVNETNDNNDDIEAGIATVVPESIELDAPQTEDTTYGDFSYETDKKVQENVSSDHADETKDNVVDLKVGTEARIESVSSDTLEMEAATARFNGGTNARESQSTSSQNEHEVEDTAVKSDGGANKGVPDSKPVETVQITSGKYKGMLGNVLGKTKKKVKVQLIFNGKPELVVSVFRKSTKKKSEIASDSPPFDSE